MTLEERLLKIEAAFGAQSDLLPELRDAVTVTAQLEARQGRLVKKSTACVWRITTTRWHLARKQCGSMMSG
jgi:hypothetical protein